MTQMDETKGDPFTGTIMLFTILFIVLILALVGHVGGVVPGPSNLTTILVVLLILVLLGFLAIPGPYGYHYYSHPVVAP